MGLNISKSALDRSHRIGNPKTKKKSRPIIVKFVRYYDRRDVFMNKKCLKGKGKSITESLTAFRMQKLKNAKDKHGFYNFGQLMVKYCSKIVKMENRMFTMVKLAEMLTIYGKENYTICWVSFLYCYVLR